MMWGHHDLQSAGTFPLYQIKSGGVGSPQTFSDCASAFSLQILGQVQVPCYFLEFPSTVGQKLAKVKYMLVFMHHKVSSHVVPTARDIGGLEWQLPYKLSYLLNELRTCTQTNQTNLTKTCCFASFVLYPLELLCVTICNGLLLSVRKALNVTGFASLLLAEQHTDHTGTIHQSMQNFVSFIVQSTTFSVFSLWYPCNACQSVVF